MYFSGYDSKDLVTSIEDSRHLKVNPLIVSSTFNNKEASTRVALDLPSLRLQPEIKNSEFIERGNASLGLESNPSLQYVDYFTNLMIRSRIKGMGVKKFKEKYLTPLFDIGDSRIDSNVQKYFDSSISPQLQSLFTSTLGLADRFGRTPIKIPPLYRKNKLIIPDIAHIQFSTDESVPFICHAIGDIESTRFRLSEGLSQFKDAVDKFVNSEEKQTIFRDGEWNEGVAFVLVLRKCLYHAVLCGTDRIFLTDLQSFSGFFHFAIKNDRMMIRHFLIDNPESVKHGISYRSAIAGFFYNDYCTSMNIKFSSWTAEEIKHPVDPLTNVNSDGIAESGCILEYSSDDDFEFIRAKTYCRIVYNSKKCYPNLVLPTTVFSKMYYYNRDWLYEDEKNIMEKFHNEVDINERIGKSQFASNFCRVLASGHWNGERDRPMLIFEYLGKSIPKLAWDRYKVYHAIKARLKNLHSIGIVYNDIRIPNIHVSSSGKVTLIDFANSYLSCDEEKHKEDFKALDEVFGVNEINTFMRVR
ncbi:uncharacterized protein RJT20DRAFT_151951 [Scheffersomyces xylosifermentans]|uniref:uncharacterized protein n=1 Tax=Scheffersomyces xylosifermentans TaxID=1304137 RepID=UPI00315C9E58